MKIIISEAQYKQLTEENLREFLFSFWDQQKNRGEQPNIDDIIYQVTGIEKGSREDLYQIMPLWYEYKGGVEPLKKQLKEEVEGKTFQIKGEFNLDMEVLVEEVHFYKEDFYSYEPACDLITRIIDGVVDAELYDQDTDTFVWQENQPISYVYSELEYDSGDFTDFLKLETKKFFEEKIKHIGLPIYIDLYGY
jgi:hypothetical protein